MSQRTLRDLQGRLLRLRGAGKSSQRELPGRAACTRPRPRRFDGGHDALTEWLQHHARNATGQGTRTYLLIEEANGAVAGYFAVAPYLVERETAPPAVGRGAPKRIPAILLAKLALRSDLHDRGLGAELLVYALTAILTAARSAGGRLVVVDAVDSRAANFYRAHNFKPSPTDPRRLIMKLSTTARALDLPWP